MKGYKGFDKDIKCRDKQYALGREETEDEQSLARGFLQASAIFQSLQLFESHS
jgi:hypothetical protein